MQVGDSRDELPALAYKAKHTWIEEDLKRVASARTHAIGFLVATLLVAGTVMSSVDTWAVSNVARVGLVFIPCGVALALAAAVTLTRPLPEFPTPHPEGMLSHLDADSFYRSELTDDKIARLNELTEMVSKRCRILELAHLGALLVVAGGFLIWFGGLFC